MTTETTDYDKYDEVGVRIAEFRKKFPIHPNVMTDSLRKQLDDLVDEQMSHVRLIEDKPRR